MTVSESQPDDKAERPDMVLANWNAKFWAAFIDAVILNLAIGVVLGGLSMKMWMGGFANTTNSLYGND